MDFIVKLLFLGGKYISQAAGRTILEIYYRSKQLGRHMSIQYEKASEIIKPYDNMLELLNDRAREEKTEDDVHLAFMNDELKKQLEEHLKRIPMQIKSEQINELCKNDASSGEIQKEWKSYLVEEPTEDTFASVDDSLISKDCEYDKMFTDLCKDLSTVSIKNFSENNSTKTVDEFPSINIAFKTSQTYEVQESLKVASEITKESSKDEDLKPTVLEDLERNINASNIEVFQFNSSPPIKDETRFNMEYLKKYQKSGQNPLSSLYSQDASYMKYLVDQSPSNSYFNTNAIKDKNVRETGNFSDVKEQSRSSYVSDMQLPKNNFFNADEVMQINNQNIISGLHQEIENRMILLNKNKEHFKDFERKLHDRLLKTKVKQTTTISKFDSNLDSKLKRSTNAKMTLKRPMSSGNTANSESDLTETRNEFTKLLSVNEKEFQKLERKITQRLIRFGLNNADIMKMNYKEIRKPVCKNSLSNTDKEDINERAKIMEVNNKVFEKFEKDMRNIVILEKNKQLDEVDKLISDEMEKYRVNMQKFPNHYTYDDKHSMRKLDKSQYVNIRSDFPHEKIKGENETSSRPLKCKLSSAGVENIRERTEILETNPKAFDMLEREIGSSSAKNKGYSNNKTYDSDHHSNEVMKTLKDILDNSRIFKPPKSTQTCKNSKSINKTDSEATNFAKCKRSAVNGQIIGSISRYKSPTKETKERPTIKKNAAIQEKSKEDSKVKKQGENSNETSKQNFDDTNVKQYIMKKHVKFTDTKLRGENQNKDNVASNSNQKGYKVTKCKQEKIQDEKNKKFQKQFTEQCTSGKIQVAADDNSREEQVKSNNRIRDKRNISEQFLEGQIRNQNFGDCVNLNSAKEVKDTQCSKIPRIQPVQKILHGRPNISQSICKKPRVKETKSENNIKMSENGNAVPLNEEQQPIKEFGSKQSEITSHITKKITNKRSASVPLRTYGNKTTSDLLKNNPKSHNATEHIAIKTKPNDDNNVITPLARFEKVVGERLKNYYKIQHASHNILQALDTIEKGIASNSQTATSKVINKKSEISINPPQQKNEDGKVDSIIGSDENNNLSKTAANNMKTKISRMYNRRTKARSQSASSKSLEKSSENDNCKMLANMPKRETENTKVITRQVKSTSQLETFSSESQCPGKKINLADTKIVETRIPTYISRTKRNTLDGLNAEKSVIQEFQNNEDKLDLKNRISKELKSYKSPKANVNESKEREIEIAKVLEFIEHLTKEKQSNNQTNEAMNTVLNKALQLLQELQRLSHSNKLANENLKSAIDKSESTNESHTKHKIPSKVNKHVIKLKQPGFITKSSKRNSSNIGRGGSENEGDNFGKMGDNPGGNQPSDGVTNINKIRLKKIIAFVPADEETLEDLQKHCDKDNKSRRKNTSNEVNTTELNPENLGLKSTLKDVKNKTSVGAIEQKCSFIPTRESSQMNKQSNGIKLVNEPNCKKNTDVLDNSQNKRRDLINKNTEDPSKTAGIKSNFFKGINSLADRTGPTVTESNDNQPHDMVSDEQKLPNTVESTNVGESSVKSGPMKNIDGDFIKNASTTITNKIKSKLDERELVVNRRAQVAKPKVKTETNVERIQLEESENQPPQRYIDYKILNLMKEKEKEALISCTLTSEEKSSQTSATSGSDNTPESETKADINTEDAQNHQKEVSSMSISALPFRSAKFSFIPLKIENCKNVVELQKDIIKKPTSEEHALQEKPTKVESPIKSEAEEPNTDCKEEFRNLALQVCKKVQSPVQQNSKTNTVQKDIFINGNIREKARRYFNETELERKARIKNETFLEKLRRDISLYSKIPIKELNCSTTSRKMKLKQDATVSQTVDQSNDSSQDQIKTDKKANEARIETESHINKDCEVLDKSESEAYATKTLDSSCKPKFLFREAKFLFVPLQKVHYADPDDVQEKVEVPEDINEEIIEQEAVEPDPFPEAMSPLLRYFMKKQLRKKVCKSVKLPNHDVQEDFEDPDENLSGAQKAIQKFSFVKKQKNVATPDSEKVVNVYERYPLLLKYKRNLRKPAANKIPRGALEWKLRFAQQLKFKQHVNKSVEYPL